MGLSKEYRFFLIWAILGTISTLIIWYLPWRFQVNDDPIMMWLVSGAYTGEPESYAVFIHPILSWVFAKLYTFLPQINWYPITWFLVMYFSLLNLIWCIWKSNADKLSNTFYSLFLVAFVIHFLFFLQFSIVAAFAIASGLTARILKFSNSAISRESSSLNLGWGKYLRFYKSDALIVLGALIRIEVLFLFLSGIVVLGLITFKKGFQPKSLILPSAILLALSLSNLAWIELEGLGDFNDANKLRSSVFDDPVLQLQKESYKETDPDLYYFANGLIDFGRDSNLIKRLEIWETKLDQRRFALLSPSYLFKALTYWILHERYFCFLLFLLLGVSLFVHLKKSLISIGILCGIMIILAPFFLIKIQVYVILLLVFFSYLILLGQGKKLNRKIAVPAVFVLPILIAIHFYSIFNSEKNLFPKEEFEEFKSFEGLKSDFENIYLVGLDNVNYRFVDHKPVEIKYLGWPTLLFNKKDKSSVYRVDKVVYQRNLGYFKSTQVLKEHPAYLDLVFLK